jgi:UDP-glucose 4-epimerase
VVVLITGGAGYVGSHTAKALSRVGVRAIVVDKLQRGHQQAVQWGPLIEADLADREALKDVFRRYPIEAVIHFAAFAYVGESM